MKFTLALLSLATLAFSAPGGDPTKLVAGAVAGVGAAVKPLGVAVGALTGAGLKVTRREVEVGAVAAAGARLGLGSIPKHVNSRRSEQDLDLAALEAKVKALVGAGGAKISRRDVQTVGALIAPVEVQVKAIVAQLGSKTITLDEVKVLVPQLTAILVSLKAQLNLLAPLSKEVTVILGTDTCDTIALKLAELIDTILTAVDCVETTLVAVLPEIKPLIVILNGAIQDVLVVAISLVAGLNVAISKLPIVKHIAVTLKHLGLQLNVGIAGL